MFDFFFFKQKTAYEMRISDWSSDVCSSDLCCHGSRSVPPLPQRRIPMTIQRMSDLDLAGKRVLIRQDLNVPVEGGKVTSDLRILASLPTLRAVLDAGAAVMVMSHLGRPQRSEEHTSELQSLMRISYAVFCLQKKNTHPT